MSDQKPLPIRPYARLLTMLGEQLIKNEGIALIELIKNSYDADADWVKVTFEKFDNDYKIEKNSKIIIEDNGQGMNQELIEKHWMNPATPEKKRRKQIKDTTDKGRIIQGEKGIGRFAILKLGRKIDIITKVKKDNQENIITYDFSRYDDDFLLENGKEKDIYIDELKVTLENRTPERIVPGQELSFGARKKKRQDHGTIIEISNLKGSWSEKKVESVYRDLAKLESIFIKRDYSDFEVAIFKDDIKQTYQENYIEKLKLLMSDRSVIKVEDGIFDANNLEYRFKMNGEQKSILLTDEDTKIRGLKPFRERFGKSGETLKKRKIACGSFGFGFYVFDFSPNSPAKYKLDTEDKEILKSHRIYLYRDNIRVYPYGDPDDDWLQIDIHRGTVSAGGFFSNNQVVGYINITHKNNPNLKDKTDREGLLSEGDATEDFIVIVQSFLYYMRNGPYLKYQIDLKKKKEQHITKSEKVLSNFLELKSTVGDNKKAQLIIAMAEKEYKTEKKYLMRRAETTEDLAGVGLSVETASHDIMGLMGRVFTNIDGLIRDLMSTDEINEEELLKELQSIRGGMSFIEAQLKDIQLLFKSSKQRRKPIRVESIVEKVERIYRRILDKESIQFTINRVASPLIAKTTDAVLLQLLLNLFDNSIYWLQQTSRSDKKIEILLDGNKCRMIFSDNGPGIDKDDAPYIFEPFYSSKGQEGRGLGLYIAKQLLERNEYSIDLAEIQSERPLSGASFVINFFTEEN